MIYPNEKEIEKMAKNAAHEQCELLDTYSAHSDSVKLGAAWAIAEIQKRSSVGFDEWISRFMGETDCMDKEAQRLARRSYYRLDAWQAATLAAEARHQEALRVKDERIAELEGEIEYLQNPAVDDFEHPSKVHGNSICYRENELLKVELESLRTQLKDARDVIGFYAPHATYEVSGTIGPQETWKPAPISGDCGKRARAFLAKYPKSDSKKVQSEEA